MLSTKNGRGRRLLHAADTEQIAVRLGLSHMGKRIAGRDAPSRWPSRAMVSTWRNRSSLHTSVPWTEAADALGRSVSPSVRAAPRCTDRRVPKPVALGGPALAGMAPRPAFSWPCSYISLRA